jgi:hypothetical protein
LNGVGLIALIPILAAAGGFTNLVLLLTAIGGSSGIGWLASAYVQHWQNKRKAVVDNRSVAITELEKAVPGMADIIKEWQNIVQQLHTDLNASRKALEDCYAEQRRIKSEREGL